jgi:hypothetical protein
VRAGDVELIATVVVVKVVAIATRIVRLRSKRSGARPRGLLVPGRYRSGIFVGLLGPVLFAMLTNSGPVRWLADWKLHHLGLASDFRLTALQLFFVTVTAALLLLRWLGNRREAEVGPDQTAAMLAEAEAETKHAPKVVSAVLGGAALAAGMLCFIFGGPLTLHPAALWIGQILSTALIFVAAGIVVVLAHAWKPGRPRPADPLS